MALAFVGLGSNIGDGRSNLHDAWKRLGNSDGTTLLALSNPYLSAPIGMDSALWFTNAVGVINTSLTPDDLLDLLLATEQQMGRDRSSGKDRVIDLDLIFYNDLVRNSGRLTLPHPEIQNRMFVLAPLEELAPDHIHPVFDLTTTEMRKRVVAKENQSIKPINWSD
jgi:2-amino-4-hydroxy-6-hydroxymethyldihydropteridine diphosphokinase